MLLKGIILGVLPVFALAWLLFCFWVQPAVAAQPAPAQGCGSYEAVSATLRQHYGETEFSFGIEKGDKSVMPLFVNTQTGTWTMVRVQPGVACALASGKDFILKFGKPV